MPIRYANQKRIWLKAAIAAWLIIGTLAYGHSYRYNWTNQGINQIDAIGAGILGPFYWLSVLGVAVFDGEN